MPAGRRRISGALYYADLEMKTEDNYFRGFSGRVDLMAFYLLLLSPAMDCRSGQPVALTFAAAFVHPSR